MPRHSRIADLLALACCIFFLVWGSLWISSEGIQSDEALFASAIYPPFADENTIAMFGRRVPMMVMSYVGALKGLLYSPIASVFAPSAAFVRIPILILGSATVWLFYALLKRALDLRSAIVGVALLACDSMFVLTTRWDWGPVAIQHFCLVAALLLIWRFYQEKRLWCLGAGCFLLGIGLWDKAIFAWCLAGLAVSVLVVFPKQLVPSLRPVNIAVAVFAFLLGATPLLIYNGRQNWITFRGNASYSTENLDVKVRAVQSALEGESLFGYISRQELQGGKQAALQGFQALLVNANDALGKPRTSLYVFALIASVLLIPFARNTHRRAALFALVFGSVSWLAMALTKDAGGSAHHVVLLWPLPHLVIAASFAGVSFRFGKPGAWGLALITTAVAGSGVLVTSTYYTHAARFGPSVTWTNAIYPAANALLEMDRNEVYVLDWGFFDNLKLLGQGRLHMAIPNEPDTEEGRKYARMQFENPRNIFINHTDGSQLVPNAGTAYVKFAAEQGFQRTDVRVFNDSHGRPVIEVFRFAATK